MAYLITGESECCTGHNAADGQPYGHAPVLLLSCHQPSSVSVLLYCGRNRPEMTSQASVGTLGGRWTQLLRAMTPRGFMMGLSWHNYTVYTKHRWRGSSYINWIGISFPFSHIFSTLLLWFVISSLNCTDTVKRSVQWEFSLKMLNKNTAVCMHSSLLDAFQPKWWYLASQPFILLQPAYHLRCHCHEASTKIEVSWLYCIHTVSGNATPGGLSWTEPLHPFCQLYLHEGGVTAKAISDV